MSDYLTPLAATLVAGAFTAVVVRQYYQRRRAHQLYWACGFLLFTLATALETLSEQRGWGALSYRLYYAVTAPLVAFLAVGTAHLIRRDPRWNRIMGGLVLAGGVLALLIARAMADNRVAGALVLLYAAALGVGVGFGRRTGHWGHAYAAFSLALIAAFVVVVAASPVDTGELDTSDSAKVGGEGLPDATRALSPLLTIPATFVLVGGAVYSWGVVWRASGKLLHDRTFNLLIAAGALVVAGSGGLAKAGEPAYLYLGELAGIVLMFVGFMKSRAVIARRETGAAREHEQRP